MAGWLLPSASKGISADAEITVGKKEEELQVNTQLGDSSSQKAETITNVAQGMQWWQLGLLCLFAGWSIPDPQAMGRGIISFIRALLPWGGKG